MSKWWSEYSEQGDHHHAYHPDDGAAAGETDNLSETDEEEGVVEGTG